MKDARQHARLARVDVPAGVGLGDQALQLIGRAAAALAAHVDAEQAQDAVGDGRQRDDERDGTATLKARSGRATRRATASARSIA